MLSEFTLWGLAEASEVYRDVMARRGPVEKIHASGRIGPASTWNVARQRDALWVEANGRANDVDAAYDRVLKAADYAFDRMTAQGSWQPVTHDEDDSFWLGAYGQLRGLGAGAGRDQDYYRALTYLHGRLANLGAEANDRANALWFAAKAYLLGWSAFGTPALYDAFVKAADEALKRQDVDGWFRENGGFDSGYQGVSVWKMGICLCYLPDGAHRDLVWAAYVRAVDWLLDRVRSDGRIDDTGNTRTANDPSASPEGKMINYPEVFWGLTYAAKHMLSGEIQATADNVGQWALEHA